MKTTKEIRTLFIKYFENHGHTLVASSSLMPKNDPTLLFTNAGMNQFKEVFLGQEVLPYKRAVTVQRCMRAGGKHNDLENVGYTKRHHTFFEMLGNFSFGDYFKREAIKYAWEFLTGKEWLNLPPEKLWITVHEKDDEAAKIWLEEIKINPHYFSKCGDEDNFWAMGETGPCGYCSEIYFDYGADVAGGPPGNPDTGERFVEIWNLVFMQFERNSTGQLIPLANPAIDTGMGLERIAAVMQTATLKDTQLRGDNYRTDVFEDFFTIFKKKVLPYYSKGETLELYTASRVIEDHLRASVALIIDGIVPSNERRGYVLRKVIRRAIYHLWKLGVYHSNDSTPVFCDWVGKNSLIDSMYDSFPEIQANWDFKIKSINEIVKTEEQQFLSTLERGLKVLEQEINRLTGNIIAGETVFYLKDTLGFPEDLTKEIAKEHNLSIDQKNFALAEEKQRQTSKAASKFKDAGTIKLAVAVGTKFEGYDHLITDSKIMALYRNNGELTDGLQLGEEGVVILDHTPFYAEAGGQIGDTGTIESVKDQSITLFEVTATKKQGAVYLHYGNIRQGKLTNQQKVTAEVNTDRRQSIKANHSAAHLLHQVLRIILGNHVEQRGSSITESSLRFDFSHFQGLTSEEINAIELAVNEKIWANLMVETKVMTLSEAKKCGAIALFDEKYADEVRVINMGDFSMELCGGTHVSFTGAIGTFKILAESAVAAGVRRIEACTKGTAVAYIQNIDKQIKTVAALLKTGVNDSISKIQQILEHNRLQEKELLQLKDKAVIGEINHLLSRIVEVNGVQVLATKLEHVDTKMMRNILDRIKSQLSSAVILLTAVINDKIQLVVGVSKNCAEQFPANDLAQYISAQIGGSGGGRNDMAQGGGTEISKIDSALGSVVEWIKQKI